MNFISVIRSGGSYSKEVFQFPQMSGVADFQVIMALHRSLSFENEGPLDSFFKVLII